MLILSAVTLLQMQIIINSIIYQSYVNLPYRRRLAAPMTWRNDGIGSEAWWQEQQTQGIPRIEPQQDGTCLVTFFWRDPQGSETTSHTQRVWINITGVTDHHQRRPPQSLMRVASSDVWYWQTVLPSHWRGSYCLMPDRQASDFSGEPDMHALRHWWRENSLPRRPMRSIRCAAGPADAAWACHRCTCLTRPTSRCGVRWMRAAPRR